MMAQVLRQMEVETRGRGTSHTAGHSGALANEVNVCHLSELLEDRFAFRIGATFVRKSQEEIHERDQPCFPLRILSLHLRGIHFDVAPTRKGFAQRSQESFRISQAEPAQFNNPAIPQHQIFEHFIGEPLLLHQAFAYACNSHWQALFRAHDEPHAVPLMRIQVPAKDASLHSPIEFRRNFEKEHVAAILA